MHVTLTAVPRDYASLTLYIFDDTFVAPLLKISQRGHSEKTLSPLKGDLQYYRRFYGFNKITKSTDVMSWCTVSCCILRSYFIVYFPGVIAVVIFVILACLAVMARFFYRRKETFQTQDSKGAKSMDSPEAAFNADPSAQSVISESQKEYFIWSMIKPFLFVIMKLLD